ncbi:hypothetical protein NQ317_001107 [Molorchus minor]|uniref:Uncharacterized protein n=1 Tax=Molorchus minor TaxID=1323400 RepID=A0ABQ9IUK3_9CUCU|nr:hypothetical protein NQ317_001107 [Molorchus minor]
MKDEIKQGQEEIKQIQDAMKDEKMVKEVVEIFENEVDKEVTDTKKDFEVLKVDAKKEIDILKRKNYLEAVTNVNSWSETEKATALIVSLRCDALKILQTLNEKPKSNTGIMKT